MSKIDKLFELAKPLPYLEGDAIDDEIITEVFCPMSVDHLSYKLEEINKRVKYKLIMADTNSNEKYGELVHLYYLDDEPMFMVNSFGKWLATKSIYYFSMNSLRTIRDFFTENAYAKHHDIEVGPTLVTEEIVGDWWEGRLVESENYPHIVKD